MKRNKYWMGIKSNYSVGIQEKKEREKDKAVFAKLNVFIYKYS
jgi:hypothetical protein